MPATPKSTPPRRDLVVESLLVLALAGQVLLLVALVLHGPEDRFSRGIVGSVGAFAANAVYGAFGVMSYVLVALGLWTTALRIARNKLSAPRWRAAGFVLLVLGGCTIVAKLFPETEMATVAQRPFGFAPGGAIGEGVRDLLMPAFGHFGTVLVAIVFMCTGMAFATDWLVYEMVYSGARKLVSALTHAKRFWPETALATAGDGATEIAGAAAKRSVDSESHAVVPHSPLAFAPSEFAQGGEATSVAALPAPAVLAPTSAPAPRADRFDALALHDIASPDMDGFGIDDPEIVIPADLAERLAPLPPGIRAPEAVAANVAPVVTDDADMDLDDADDDSDNDDADPVDADDDEAVAPATNNLPIAPLTLAPMTPAKPAAPVVPAAPRIERPRLAGAYEFPSTQLLERPKPRNLKQLEQAIAANAEVLQRTLQEFKIEGQVVAYQQGPVVTMLEVALAPGTKVTKIHSLADDIAMALKAESVRIVAPIPGKSTVGVEIPNPVRDDVRMLGVLESDQFRASTAAIPMLLGASADGGPLVEDLASMPHLLIAGSTGSGKSVCINTILLSILMTRTPDEVRLILIDPKQVELAFFANIPHLLSPVVTDMKRASAVLEWALDKMEERYDLLRRFEVRNIASYNELGEAAILARAKELEMDDEVVQVKLAYIVIIVDELADLMLTVGKDVETAITRLAQKSRAVGIHVILATQRPSTDVITGLIKANMPTRIAFKVASKIDSRVILDQNGAEKLLGMGDMLFMPPRSSTIARAQCTYASDREVKRVVAYLRERYPQEFSDELVNLSNTPLLDASEKDELYDEAVRIVLTEQRGSASLLQRALSIGYTRSSRLLDLMRAEGVVGVYKGSKASEVQMTLEEYEARVASQGGAPRRSPEEEFEG